ncbi:hypothetical protein YC2023_051991 [Brassica napus]
MVKTFTGRRGRARNKLQIQRGSSNPIVFEVPDVSFPPTVHEGFKVPEVSITTKKKDEEGSGFDEETVRREDEEETVVHRNEQEAMDSGENSYFEGDDCESNDNELLDVPIRKDDHFREAGCEDGNENYEGNEDSGDDI